MDPYYNDGQVALWCGDARQITTWLAADVLVTDPPYGIGTTRRRGTWDMPETRAEHIMGDRDTEVRDTILGMWAIPPLPSLASIPVDTAWWSRPAVVFGDVRLESPYPTRKTLIYRKPPDAGTHGAVAGFRHDVEAVYLMGRQGVWPTAIGGRSSILTTGARSVGSPSGPAARYGHQHAKPVDLMEELCVAALQCLPRIKADNPGAIGPDHMATTEFYTVAEPFAGAGSTIVAARNLGLKVLAVELEEANCERIVARLKQGALSFDA